MIRSFKSDTTSTARTLKGSAVLIVLSALIAGCSSGYEKLEPQAYDGDYDVFSVLSWSGRLDVFLIKAYESEGKVALCGGYTQGTSSFSEKGSREWADKSQVYIEGEKIGTAVFMAELPVRSPLEGRNPDNVLIDLVTKRPAMPCVKSKIPWNEKFANAKIERRGIKSIRIED